MRRDADRARARAVGAHAELHLVGVAVHDADIVDRDAEPFGDDLGERGLVTLAVLVTAGEDFDRAGRIDPHLGQFPEPDAAAERADRLARRNPAGLDIGRDADAAQLVMAGGFALALAEAVVVGDLQRLLQRGVIVAGIVVHDHGRLVRKCLDEVLLAQIGGIHAHLARADLRSTARPRRSPPDARRRGRRRPARCWYRPRRPRNRSPGYRTGRTAACRRDRSAPTTRTSTCRRRDWRWS